MYKSDITDKIYTEYFQAVSVSIILYGCTTETLMKPLKKTVTEITQ